MNDRVPKEGLGASRFNHVLLKSTRMTQPENLRNKQLALIQHLCKVDENLQDSFFCKIRKFEIGRPQPELDIKFPIISFANRLNQNKPRKD